MNQQQKKKDGLRIGSIIAITIAVLDAFGIVGVAILVPILMISLVVWKSIKATRNAKAEENSWTQSNEMQRSESRAPRQRAPQSLSDMLSSSERLHLESLGDEGHDEYRHQTQELRDLLSAGIIDRPEYNDRMALLRTEMHS